MKPILHSLLLAVFISTAACNNAKQSTPPGGNEPTPPVTDVLCPLDSAVTDIATFDTLCKRFVTDTAGETVPTVPIKGFTIHAADLFAAMGITEYQEPPYAHIRIYLGYRLNDGFKVYLVPVQGANLADNEPGTDLMLNAEGHVNPTAGEPNFVLDLNAPCPSICDINSPLFLKN
jgi:hypothetical protein